jgi:hypothetical protein
MSLAIRALVARLSAAGFIGLLVTGCGGHHSAAVPSEGTPVALSESGTFPTGLALGSPGDLQTVSLSAAESTSNLRYAGDWARGMWAGLQGKGRSGDVARLAAAVMPMGRAHADTGLRPEFAAIAETIRRVLDGDTSVDLATVLDLHALFAPSANANCYGPQMAYASHQDAGSGPSSGTLPGGDLGIWLEYENGTQPCVAAQLKHRTRGVRGQAMQGLVMTALMRLTISRSATLSMPAAGGTTDAAAEMQAKLRTVPALATVVVHAASVSLDSTGTTFTYRLALGNGDSGANARLGEVVMTHTKGSTPTAFNGVMRVAGFTLSNDSALGCDDAKDSATGLFQVAHVSTVKYARDGASLTYGSRNANYCGHPAGTTAADYGAQVATLTSGAELDPTAKLSGNLRGTLSGWRGNFSRFAGTVDRTSSAGNYLFAWQAGTMDNASRMLAVTSDYNSATDTRTLSGYFAFGGDVATTDGTLQGMICNWAGPGNSHTPQASFQSQVATHSGSAIGFSIAAGGSKIAYAPTNACSSTSTSFDVDVNGTLAAGEGVGTISGLDVPAGANTVQQEIEARGFAKPILF